MQKPRILISDLAEDHSVRAKLIDILTAIGSMDIQTRLDSWGQQTEPDVTFLIITSQTARSSATTAGFTFCSPTIAVAADCTSDQIMDFLRSGVHDFVVPPFCATDLLTRIRRLTEHHQSAQRPVNALKEKLGLQKLVGRSSAFLSEVQKIPHVAAVEAGVLIVGETGTGKEMFARAIHYLSPRSGKPFIPVNCAAIPVDLFENELFGHESGAYTSATTTKEGLIHSAEGGTLFLDEIDSLPLIAQVKLLRFLQEREYRPLGSPRTVKGDIRIIAASNADLEKARDEGRLRSDLYYRLNVLPLVIPPLRNRVEDIVPLAEHFLSKYSNELNKRIAGFSGDAIQVLVAHEWPGNVRELEFVIERAVVFARQTAIQASDLMFPSRRSSQQTSLSFNERKAQIIAEFEKSYIQRLLIECQGNVTRAAQAMKKNRRAFWHLMQKYRLHAEFKGKDALDNSETE